MRRNAYWGGREMKHLVVPALAAMALAGCAGMGAGPGMPGGGEMKIAFDITEGNPEVLLRKLDTIDLTRKQLIKAGITPRMVLSFRGGATYYTQTELYKVKESHRADALRIAARLRQLRKEPGIETMEQCNVTITNLKLNPKALMPEVRLVDNGWIALVGHQQRGYGYIVP